MRTTIRIDDQLLREAKQLALRNGKSLTSIIEEALREKIYRQRNVEKREPVQLVPFRGNGLLPGVDLDDSAALLDLMESSHDPD
jgi:hypothetical protein